MKIDLVIDTNVLLEFYSIHDIMTAYSINPQINNQELIWRRHRARQTILLMWELHKDKMTTYGIISESITQLKKNAPPTSSDLRSLYATININFVHPFVFPFWKNNGDLSIINTGNAADDHLLTIAQQNQCLIISDEGFTADGKIKNTKGMRKKALNMGVTIKTPGEFLNDKQVDEKIAAQEVLKQFKNCLPLYMNAHEYANNQIVANNINTFYACWRHILLGEINDPNKSPVQVVI